VDTGDSISLGPQALHRSIGPVLVIFAVNFRSEVGSPFLDVVEWAKERRGTSTDGWTRVGVGRWATTVLFLC
jgi:hypothetical protein